MASLRAWPYFSQKPVIRSQPQQPPQPCSQLSAQEGRGCLIHITRNVPLAWALGGGGRTLCLGSRIMA